MEAYTKGRWSYKLDLAKQLLETNNDMRLMGFKQRSLDQLGPNLQQRLLGDVRFVTIDPENVEAVLSSPKSRKES